MINHKVMTDTLYQIQNNPKLAASVKKSISKQCIVPEEDSIHHQSLRVIKTTYLVSGKRSFEAAKAYPNKRVAVLNFANNHVVGGAPFSSGAQEESLCRCSTLYPCLKAMEKEFYVKHANDYHNGKLSNLGNDDIIYTPDVVVFKTDERTDPVIPQMLPENEWYLVNIISCAAPEFRPAPNKYPDGYETIIHNRIKKILDVAARELNEVLILGAWGCGAFGNSKEIVARCFMKLLPEYDFETVEFALPFDDLTNNPFSQEVERYRFESEGEEVHSPFVVNPTAEWFLDTLLNATGENMSTEKKKRMVAEMEQNQKDQETETAMEKRFRQILGSFNREGMDILLKRLKLNHFFTAPASVNYHSNKKGGLVDHSLKVYDCAMRLRSELLRSDPTQEINVPEESVAIAALLHDVCKIDHYTIDVNGKAHHLAPKLPIGGHGYKSVIMLMSWGLELKPLEILAIRWHMGKGDILSNDEKTLNEYEKALKEFGIVKLIVNADYAATHPKPDMK